MSGQIEYAELRRRGATRLMCETFNLEFNAATGIFAWADGDIYREFAGPLMQVGDFWKIMLGRRIQLDEDDPDGSLFIEAVLEDALLFPLFEGQKWETVEDGASPGIWITRPVDAVLPAVSVSGSASGSSESSDSDSDTWGAKEVDNRLEPGYVAPSLPVQNQNYETSDAESDGDMDIDMTMDDPSVKGEENEDRPIEEAAEGDDDPGWTWDPSIPDTCWLPGNEASDEDSADSDFDSNDSC
ncbi:hypothetical protein K438DRAFT_1800139 [Mycena galopus ATCC 62051]|nr:hypothetical protein K438DRAFT_1800139 [Mycena galopus ATCC 62051]